MVTTTGTVCPAARPLGTVAKIAVSFRLTIVAAAPPNVTVLLPFVAPKLAPEIATQEPTAAEPGARPTICGGAAVAAPTVSVLEPQMEPVQALTVAEPCATPNAVP